MSAFFLSFSTVCASQKSKYIHIYRVMTCALYSSAYVQDIVVQVHPIKQRVKNCTKTRTPSRGDKSMYTHTHTRSKTRIIIYSSSRLNNRPRTPPLFVDKRARSPNTASRLERFRNAFCRSHRRGRRRDRF